MGTRRLPADMAGRLYGAAAVIAERGLHDAKMDDIAAAAGIPRATLYYHFSGKEEILSFLLTDLLEHIAGQVRAAMALPGSARDRLEGALLAQLTGMLEHPAVCRALVGDLGRATRLPELASALSTAFYEPFEELLNQGVQDGSLRRLDDPAGAALAIFGAVTVAGLSHVIAEPAPDPRTVAASVNEVVIGGLAPDG